jgi:hypothetical protein
MPPGRACGASRSFVPNESTTASGFRASIASISIVASNTNRRFGDTTVAPASDTLTTAKSGSSTIVRSRLLICATALVNGLSLATRNVDDFDGCGVVVVDPFLP